MYVTVPEPITMLNLANGKPLPLRTDQGPNGERVEVPDAPWDMWRFLVTFVTGDPKMGKGRVGGKRLTRLVQAFEGAEARRNGDEPLIVEVKDDDHTVVDDILDEPSGEWNGLALAIFAQCAPFADAWENATKTDPRAVPVAA